MPIIWHPILILTGVLAHRGNPNAVAGGLTSKGYRFKELGHDTSLAKASMRWSILDLLKR